MFDIECIKNIFNRYLLLFDCFLMRNQINKEYYTIDINLTSLIFSI